MESCKSCNGSGITHLCNICDITDKLSYAYLDNYFARANCHCTDGKFLCFVCKGSGKVPIQPEPPKKIISYSPCTYCNNGKIICDICKGNKILSDYIEGAVRCESCGSTDPSKPYEIVYTNSTGYVPSENFTSKFHNINNYRLKSRVLVPKVKNKCYPEDDLYKRLDSATSNFTKNMIFVNVRHKRINIGYYNNGDHADTIIWDYVIDGNFNKIGNKCEVNYLNIQQRIYHILDQFYILYDPINNTNEILNLIKQKKVMNIYFAILPTFLPIDLKKIMEYNLTCKLSSWTPPVYSDIYEYTYICNNHIVKSQQGKSITFTCSSCSGFGYYKNSPCIRCNGTQQIKNISYE